MQRTGMHRNVMSRLLVGILTVALVFTMMPLSDRGISHAATGTLEVSTPALVATGQGLIGGGTYSTDNVSSEKSWSLDELKAMGEGNVVTGEMYSSRKQLDPYTKSYIMADGIRVTSLIDGLESVTDEVSFLAPDGYKSSFKNGASYENPKLENAPGLTSGRYYYDGFGQTPTKEVPVILSWATGETEGTNGQPPETKPTATTEHNKKTGLLLVAGQYGAGDGSEDKNRPLYIKNVKTIQVGTPVTETVLTVGSKTYTRSEVLMMDFAENTYTYDTSGGSATDFVRGVPMSVLLDGYDDDDVVSFEAADGYPVTVSGYTVGQLVENDYMLAYEKGSSAADLAGIYETAKNDASKYGFFRLYGSDENGKPAKLVNKITVTKASGEDYSNSPYKHITNGGQGGDAPYNIDAITGATLTVEGPGVEKSVPVSVRDLEGRDAGIKRANYTDKRNGVNATRTYEGIDLQYILTKMNSGDNGIKMTNKAKKVLIKNRNRSTIAEFTTDQVAEASGKGTPILVAYGTSNTDGSNIRPFVFDNAAGSDSDLGNEDGCLKLVYDKSAITDDQNPDYTTFGNMAYIYVAEEDTPGYKHDKDPYQSAEISNYVLTVTGDKIGREVNYTVEELENMVEYDTQGKPDNNGMGYRDEYSLANSTYWYVNEYEGVQLWKLLLRSGLSATYSTDDETIVSSTATDGYAATDKFTTKQVADPDSFGFYEKNPADNNDGTYEGNENIRQGNDVATGDKLRVGYPVLVAYGVNGYPYVEKSTQEGYLSGLQNDGGPLRIISGKKQYNHANGSNQAKLLDKVLVGSNTYHYSTHKYHQRDVYKDLANSELNVKVYNGSDSNAPIMKDSTYTTGDLEDLIYGGSLTATQLKKAKVKEFYGLPKNGQVYSDLFEGVSLQYFLTDVVELPGYKGTITFGNGKDSVTMNLDDVLRATGSNADTGIDGLVPVIAYGKNGAPMVATKEAADGYEDKVTLAEGTDYANQLTIKNNGGPLELVFPKVEGNTEISEKTVTGINSITVNLSPDNYAHTKAPYDTYKNNRITISGEGTRLTEAKEMTVEELEGKQTIAFTGDYSILKDGQTDASQTRYRGIDLYALLTSPAVGLKSNADKVIVTTTDNETKEFTLSEIRKKYTNTITGDTDLPVLLAYGTGIAGADDKEDGKPLVTDKNSDGYDSAYGNTGGPVRLAVGQTEEGDVNSGKNMKFVKSIEVTASDITSWNHSVSEIFKQYLSEEVELQVVDKDGNELFKKSYTVGDIEEQTSLIERITAKTTQEDTWEGINFWAFVKQEVGDIAGVDDPVNVDVFAADGFTKELRSIFGMDALQDGIKDGENYVPIILAYGVNGAPLVIGDKSHSNGEGYDATIGNNGGPIRLVTHNNQGASLTYVKRIKITAGDGTPDPVAEDADFTIKGLSDEDVELSVDQISKIKNASGDAIGQAEATFAYGKKGSRVNETVKGISLKNLLANQGMELDNAKITLNTTDGYESSEPSYQDIAFKDAKGQNYFLAYQVFNSETSQWEDIADSDNKDDPEQGNIAKLRIYRNYNEAQGNNPEKDWRNRCTNIKGITLELPEVTEFKEYPAGSVRSTWIDKDGTTWVGTYGGGLYFKKAHMKSWQVLNTESTPALQTNYTSAVAADSEGGIWVSQNASYTDPTNNQGVLYIKDGEITQYTAEGAPWTIPNNYVQAIQIDKDGKVWFGSFGGLTIYDPQADEGDQWTTYEKATAGFPATSVNTITLDGEGGAWLGFYPDGTGTEEAPYVGGFCHIDGEGNVSEVNEVTGKMTQDGSTSKLAQAWVRSIAIDQKGTVWVVASGTNLQENEGGTIWKLKNGTGAPTVYTGKEVFADYLDGSSTTEVRVVAVDKEGNLWFGTSADGVLVVSNPKVVDGKMTVDAQYAKETGSWKGDGRNNVYHISFWNDGTAYVGSAGGLQVLGEEPTSDKEIIGGETLDSAALVVNGDGVVNNGCFSVKSLKNTGGIEKVDATYSWMNKSGSTGENTFQGVYLDNLLSVVGLADEAYRFTVIAKDGKSKEFDLDDINVEDKDGHKMMIAWQSDEDPSNTKIDPKLVIGQADENDINKSSWMSQVVEIRVDISTAEEKTELAEESESALQEIEQIEGEIQLDEYDEEGKALIQEIIESTIQGIEGAQTAGGVIRVLAAGKAALAQVKTAAQKAAELAEAKANACDLIDQVVEAAKQDLAGIEDADERAAAEQRIDTAAAAAKASIDEIGKIENVAPIAAESAQSIREIADAAIATAADKKAKAEAQALANAKDEAIKSVLAALSASEGKADAAALSKAALAAILAINTADKIEDVNKARDGAVGAMEKLVEDKQAADQNAATAQTTYQQNVNAAQALTVTKFKVKAKKKKKAKLTWKKTAGASGYEIYRATKKNGKYKLVKTIGNAGTVKFTNKKLKAKKKYFYKIRPYTLVTDPSGKTVKVYGKYTTVKKIKAKK